MQGLVILWNLHIRCWRYFNISKQRFDFTFALCCRIAITYTDSKLYTPQQRHSTSWWKKSKFAGDSGFQTAGVEDIPISWSDYGFFDIWFVTLFFNWIRSKWVPCKMYGISTSKIQSIYVHNDIFDCRKLKSFPTWPWVHKL